MSNWFVYLIIPPGACLLIFLAYKYIKKPNKNELNNRYATAVLFYIVFFITHPLLLISGVSEEFAIAFSNIGMIITAIVFARMLSRNFNQEHDELIDIKGSLEQKVQDRTRELELAKNLIERQSKEKTTFFINLAHETKTPLTIIKSSLSRYVKDNGLNPELIEIQRNIDRLLRDMVNFLDVEKIEQGKTLFFHDQLINLSNFLKVKADSFKSLAINNNVVLTYDIEENIFIKADSFGIDRVLNNLLDNAIKYNRPNGTINVRLFSSENQVLIEIADTGIGIPENQLSKIFEPYYQVSHKKRNIQGLGMGLTITKKIIDSLNGNISLVSKYGEFTVFSINLSKYCPADNEEIPEISISTPQKILTKFDLSDSIDPAGDRVTIMVVEDNESLLSNLRKELSIDYNVICALNGKLALDKLNDMKLPDLIISDVMMDVMDGYELLNNISKSSKYRQIPFLFLTAKSSEGEAVRGLSSGAVDYIQKPFSIEYLITKVKSILEFNAVKKSFFTNEKYKSLGMLTASISHEILNPLSGIKGPLFILDTQLKKEMVNIANEPVLKSIDYIKQNVTRIESIVLTLKSLFHGDTFSSEKIPLHEIFTVLRNIFQEKVKDRINIISNVTNEVYVVSNRSALTQILINLISNSIESIPQKGWIKLDFLESSGPQIRVKDSGCGINPSSINKIFDLGFTQKEIGKGTGLGLYIVKELAEKLNISIKVNSEINKGTEFVLEFNS
jgi:signal transduction histidine kinase